MSAQNVIVVVNVYDLTIDVFMTQNDIPPPFQVLRGAGFIYNDTWWNFSGLQ